MSAAPVSDSLVDSDHTHGSYNLGKHCKGWTSLGNYESMKANAFLVLCGAVGQSAMARMVEWDSYKALYEHFAKHWEQIGIERENPIGISFALVAS